MTGAATDRTGWREQFLANARRLVAARGDWVPPLTPALLRQADHLIVGELYRADGGESWVRIDPDTVDWTGQSLPVPRRAHAMLMIFRLLGPLAAAYRETRDERYAQSARRYFEAFLRAHPVTPSWAPSEHDGATCFPGRIGSTRSPGWLGLLPAFDGSPAFDDAFFDIVIRAARDMLTYLAAHVYPGRNIRILHGDVLLLGGIRLSFLPEAAAWRELGARIVNDAVVRQILPDGADMEGSAEYHCDVLELLAELWRLARSMPELGLRIPAEVIAGMYDYALHVTRPDGALTPINDTSYSPGRSAFGAHLAEARRAFRTAIGQPDELPPPCRHYRDVGQVFLRDSWGPDATYITFDATLRRGWHWHPGRNAIQLFAHGRPLVVDPGYTVPGQPCGRGTAHHSTVNINGLDQAHTLTWSRLRQAPGYDLVEGHYSGGYWPNTPDERFGAGIFGEHHRAMLWIRGRCIVVLDHILTKPERNGSLTIENVWQLAEGAAHVRADGRSAVTDNPDSNLLLLFPLAPGSSSVTAHAGERDPMRGWVVDIGRARPAPAPMIRLSATEREPWKVHLATILIPFAGGDAPELTATAQPPGVEFTDRTAGQLELRWSDGTSDRIVWSGRLEDSIDRQRGVDTDGELVHLRFDAAGRLAGGALAGGSFLRDGSAPGADLTGRVSRL